jgi:hypothetical protein
MEKKIEIFKKQILTVLGKAQKYYENRDKEKFEILFEEVTEEANVLLELYWDELRGDICSEC